MHIQFVNERECVNSLPKRGLKLSLPRGYTISLLRKRHNVSLLIKGYVVGPLRRECETSSLMKEYIVNNGKKIIKFKNKI